MPSAEIWTAEHQARDCYTWQFPTPPSGFERHLVIRGTQTGLNQRAQPEGSTSGLNQRSDTLVKGGEVKRKTHNSLLGFFSLKEPSSSALEEFERQQQRQA